MTPDLPPELPDVSRTNGPLVLGCNGFVAAIERQTGAELWRTRLQTGVFTATAASDVAVLVAADRVFAGSRGHLFCLELASGRVLWHNELTGMGYNDVALALEGVSIQYLTTIERQSSGH